MILTEEDRNSPLWLKLKTEWEARLTVLRGKNDDASDALTERATYRLRGQIDELKRNLDLGKVKAKIEVE